MGQFNLLVQRASRGRWSGLGLGLGVGAGAGGWVWVRLRTRLGQFGQRNSHSKHENKHHSTLFSNVRPVLQNPLENAPALDDTWMTASFFFSSHTYTFQLMDKPWSRVSSLLPPGSCLQFLSRIGLSNHTARRFFIECCY